MIPPHVFLKVVCFPKQEIILSQENYTVANKKGTAPAKAQE
jgi:hypothetical protein